MAQMFSPLIPVQVASIYNNKLLPSRMARCTPDTSVALAAVVEALRSLGHDLRLSDLFRSYEMQRQAHLDYREGRKTAFSPPPGGSLHEAGRAMDIDLSSMGVPLKRFWEIAKSHGFFPIIDSPNPARSEAWHFDCRGSHNVVYEYVKRGKAGSLIPPYTQMAHSAILSIGVQLDMVPDQTAAFIQAGLIRLGFDPGRIDGVVGARTLAAMRDAEVDPDDPAGSVSSQLKQRFAAEY
jgi:zinc D-Ala-D-Ala carboxypeptidase